MNVSTQSHMSLANVMVCAMLPHQICSNDSRIPACDYANDRIGFPPVVIYGILCDATSLEFFSFDGSPSKPIFSRGVFYDSPSSKPRQTLTIAEYHSTSKTEYIRSLRPVCETLFYFFLLAYKAGINTCINRSVRIGIKERCRQETTPNWPEAKEHADEALRLAVDAAIKANSRHDILSVDEATEKALTHLKKRYESL
jgi:hypothetical protein